MHDPDAGDANDDAGPPPTPTHCAWRPSTRFDRAPHHEGASHLVAVRNGDGTAVLLASSPAPKAGFYVYRVNEDGRKISRTLLRDLVPHAVSNEGDRIAMVTRDPVTSAYEYLELDRGDAVVVREALPIDHASEHDIAIDATHVAWIRGRSDEVRLWRRSDGDYVTIPSSDPLRLTASLGTGFFVTERTTGAVRLLSLTGDSVAERARFDVEAGTELFQSGVATAHGDFFVEHSPPYAGAELALASVSPPLRISVGTVEVGHTQVVSTARTSSVFVWSDFLRTRLDVWMRDRSTGEVTRAELARWAEGEVQGNHVATAGGDDGAMAFWLEDDELRVSVLACE